MLELHGVTKVFRSDILKSAFTALDGVSFRVPEGAMVGFLGANGAGKTTAIKVVLDFIRADSGEVHYGPEITRNGNLDFSYVGYLPERPYFYPHLTGREFIRYMGELAGVGRGDVAARTAALAPRFRIDHALDRPLRNYSKGMLQRTGFLVTVLHRPKLIILDEPLSGLDPVGRVEMKEIMSEVHREGCTVFFSSHVVPDVEEVCQRVVFLQQGKLAYDGPVDSLLRENVRQAFHITVPELPSDTSTPLIAKERLNDGNIRLEVASSDKDRLLAELVAKGTPVHALQQVRPSLEEIFYHIRR